MELGEIIPDQRLWVFMSAHNHDLISADGTLDLLEEAGAVAKGVERQVAPIAHLAGSVKAAQLRRKHATCLREKAQRNTTAALGRQALLERHYLRKGCAFLSEYRAGKPTVSSGVPLKRMCAKKKQL